MTEITLDFIARQIERVLSEQADIRDQLKMVNARLTSIEVRMNDRIRKLEA